MIQRFHGYPAQGYPEVALILARPLAVLLAGMLVAGSVGGEACAQSNWNPFADQQGVNTAPPRRPVRPAPGETAKPPLAPLDGPPGRQSEPRQGDPRQGEPQPGPNGVAGGLPDGPVGPMAPRDTVETSDLPPLTPGEGPGTSAATSSAVTSGAGLDWARLSKEIQVPARSPALARLLLRLAEDAGGGGLGAEAAVPRAALLFRAGRLGEADEGVTRAILGATSSATAGRQFPVLAALGMRLALGVGDRDRACRNAQTVVQDGGELPPAVRGEAIAVQGYCGAASGNLAAAGLAAQLAREQGGLSPETLALLEAVSSGDPAPLSGGNRMSVLDWRLLEVANKAEGGKPETAQTPVTLAGLERMEPATLRVIALSPVAKGAWRITAAEAAARINAIDPVDLAEAYRQQAFTAAELAQGQAAKVEPALRRALLFRAAEAERTPSKRTRLVRAALDDARRAGLYRPMAAALVRIVEDIRQVPEVGWFAETAVEVMVAGNRLDLARRWAQTESVPRAEGERAGPQGLSHWLALIDLADTAQRPVRGTSLASVEELALRGRFTAEGLHRLATVLDALDYHVPMRLWEAASRTPQPTTGHLPATGVLPELQDAARKRDTAQTTVLVFKALGPEGPEAAHMIALGDSIRALRRAGLEADARAVAFEALFALWPRATSS